MKTPTDSEATHLPLDLFEPPPGMQKCGYFETNEVTSVCRSLLFALSTSAVEQAAGDPFSSAFSRADEVRRNLLTFAYKATEEYAKSAVPSETEEEAGRPSELLDGMFSSFISGKRNMFNQLSAKIILGDKKEDRVSELYSELNKLGFWSMERRELAAKVLIERVDASGFAHCLAVFPVDDEAALSSHQASCPLAPYTCANPGCGRVHSAKHATKHDDICLRKIVDCRLACGAQMPREETEAHCSTVCPKKPIACPFKTVGCEEGLVAGDLAKHCQEWTEKHLYFTFLSQQTVVAVTEKQSHRLAEVEQEARMAQQTHDIDTRALSAAVRLAETKVAALEGDIRKLLKGVKAVDSSSAKELAGLRSELKALKSSSSPKG